MATFYARAKIEGTSTAQHIKVEASSSSEAKKMIEMRLGGKVKSWISSPTAWSKPPSWFKG